MITGMHSWAQVGIGTTSPAAALDITSANEGILIPRVALTATNIIPETFMTPTPSELIYNTATSPAGSTNPVTPGYYYLNETASGWIRLGTGDSSSPNAAWGLRGNIDTDPASYFLGTRDARDMVIRTNDTEKMRVTSTGNIGIGTTNPGARLDISSPTLSSNPLQDGLLIKQEVDNQFSIQTYLDGQKTNPQIRNHVFDVNYTLSLQPVKGRVGIGTMAPGAKFDTVLTDVTASNPIASFSRVIPEGTPQGNLRFYSGLGNQNYNPIVSEGDKAIIFNNDGIPGTIANSGLVIAPWDATGGAKGIKIMESGNVGIGTALPGAKLTIASDLPPYTVFMRPSGGIALFANNVANLNAQLGWVRKPPISTQPGEPVLVLQGVQDGLAWRDVSIAKDGGNVGIGTDTPASKFHVQGSVGAQEIAIFGSATDNRYVTFGNGVSNTGGFIRSRTAAGLFEFGAHGVANQLVLKNDGYVGIGTADPTQKLSVVGNIGLDNTNAIAARNTSGAYEPVLYGRWNNNATYLDGGAGGTVLRTANGAMLNQFLHPNGNTGFGMTAPNAQIHLSNTVVNRKIILFENADNDHQFYGFGINGGTLRYQVPTGGFHRFFAGTSATASQQLMEINGSNGNVAILGNVSAPGFFQSSDARLKNVIKRDGDVAYYTWKDGRDKKVHVGYIAQEVQAKNPEQVNTDQDGKLSVNYIEVLVEKIRTLEKEIELLKAKK
ncbi:MAG TPA: tail fiber domain-containing protein [Flavobacterium sp.]